MILEPVTPAQIDAVLALVHRAYRGDSARRGWTHEADLLDGQRTDAEALSEMIADPDQHLFAAWDGDAPFACIAITMKPDALAYLGMITVDPGRQAAGLGRALLAAGEEQARRLGASRAEMTVITLRHELIAWYERRGYGRTGEERPFPDDPRFGEPRQALRFLVLEKPL